MCSEQLCDPPPGSRDMCLQAAAGKSTDLFAQIMKIPLFSLLPTSFIHNVPLSILFKWTTEKGDWKQMLEGMKVQGSRKQIHFREMLFLSFSPLGESQRGTITRLSPDKPKNSSI